MAEQTEGLSKPGHCTVCAIEVDSRNAPCHDLPAPVADQLCDGLSTSLVAGNVLAWTEILQVGMNLAAFCKRCTPPGRFHRHTLLDGQDTSINGIEPTQNHHSCFFNKIILKRFNIINIII
jgi:hypothetical protein